MQHSWLLVTIFSFSAVALGALWFTGKNRKRKVPTKWKSVGKVKNLCIYPLKSGYRMELSKITCTEYGPRMCDAGVYQFYDRNLIIYKEENNENLTADAYPKISLIKVEARGKDDFVLKAPNAPDVIVKIPQRDAKTGEVRVSRDAKIFMLDCGHKVAKWLSRLIYERDSGLRLGFHDGSRRRNIYENSYLKQYCDIYPTLTNAATGMYSLLCSYSLINESSVNELKKRISDDKESVTANNFRGNIIIEDFEGSAYVEDTWSWVKIGNAVFYIVKPNTRCCMIINVDPDTAVRSKKFEPMATLKEYRQLKEVTKVKFEGDDPVIGCYMGLHQSGTMSIDDIVYVGEP